MWEQAAEDERGSLNMNLYPAALFFIFLHNIYTDESFYKYLDIPKNYYSLYSHIKQYTYFGILFNATLRAVRNWRANAKFTSP